MKLTLKYFDLKGRGEVPRLAFYVGGVDFEDDRVSFDGFKDLKPSLLYGQLPVLEVDGEQFAQAGAISRYAGRLSGLYPSDPIAALKTDEIMAFSDDVAFPLSAMLGEQDEQKKAEVAKYLGYEKFPEMFAGLEKRVASRGAAYCTGEGMTIADLWLYCFTQWVKTNAVGFRNDMLDGFPKIMEIVDRVGGNQKIKEWNAKHED